MYPQNPFGLSKKAKIKKVLKIKVSKHMPQDNTLRIYVKDFAAEECVKRNMQEKVRIGVSLIRNRKRK